MDEILKLIGRNDWFTIAKEIDPKFLVKVVPFKKGMSIAYHMLFNDGIDDDLRLYAVRLLQEIRQYYSQEWSSDWKNDVFFGDACYLTLNYEERYAAYKRAYDEAIPAPPSLLISIAGCYIAPEPSITIDEAEKLTKRALKEEMSIEGVILLRGIYAKKKDQVQFDYWDTILKKLQEKNIHTKNCWPSFLDDNLPN